MSGSWDNMIVSLSMKMSNWVARSSKWDSKHRTELLSSLYEIEVNSSSWSPLILNLPSLKNTILNYFGVRFIHLLKHSKTLLEGTLKEQKCKELVCYMLGDSKVSPKYHWYLRISSSQPLAISEFLDLTSDIVKSLVAPTPCFAVWTSVFNFQLLLMLTSAVTHVIFSHLLMCGHQGAVWHGCMHFSMSVS